MCAASAGPPGGIGAAHLGRATTQDAFLVATAARVSDLSRSGAHGDVFRVAVSAVPAFQSSSGGARHEHYPCLLLDLADACDALGRRKAAETYWSLALTAAAEGENHRVAAAARIRLADACLRRGDPRGAASHATSAVRTSVDHSLHSIEPEAHAALGRSLHAAGSPLRAEAAFADALSALLPPLGRAPRAGAPRARWWLRAAVEARPGGCGPRPAPATLFSLLSAAGAALLDAERIACARAVQDGARALAGGLGPGAQCTAACNCANVSLREGRVEEAAGVLRGCLERVRSARFGSEQQRAAMLGKVCGNLANARCAQGDTADALRLYSEQIRLARAAGDAESECRAAYNAALTCEEGGDFAGALAHYARREQLGARIGNQRARMLGLQGQVRVLRALGRGEEADGAAARAAGMQVSGT